MGGAAVKMRKELPEDLQLGHLLLHCHHLLVVELLSSLGPRHIVRHVDSVTTYLHLLERGHARGGSAARSQCSIAQRLPPQWLNPAATARSRVAGATQGATPRHNTPDTYADMHRHTPAALCDPDPEQLEK